MSLRRLKIETDIIYQTKITKLQCKRWNRGLFTSVVAYNQRKKSLLLKN